ncbi:hypothetical protein QUF76_07985 [Desulfobacterales bacterium HSG16]|nr:hypothetical protein [Desulfobacterales bacterium HSG16]
MSHELLTARLNAYAVLKNLEDLVVHDREMALFTKDWNIAIRFFVLNGPDAFVEFDSGKCRVGKGGGEKKSSVILFFHSPAHFNKMMDGKASPVPVKGFTKLRFLTKEFSVLTEKLEYYLKPNADLLADPKWVALNTRMTLTTAVWSIPELAELDPVANILSSHMGKGSISLGILPDGPKVNLTVNKDSIVPAKGEIKAPAAAMTMKDMTVANDFLNGRLDAFTAIATGDVSIRGQIPMVDTLSLMLDRIALYLS